MKVALATVRTATVLPIIYDCTERSQLSYEVC